MLPHRVGLDSRWQKTALEELCRAISPRPTSAPFANRLGPGSMWNEIAVAGRGPTPSPFQAPRCAAHGERVADAAAADNGMAPYPNAHGSIAGACGSRHPASRRLSSAAGTDPDRHWPSARTGPRWLRDDLPLPRWSPAQRSTGTQRGRQSVPVAILAPPRAPGPCRRGLPQSASRPRVAKPVDERHGQAAAKSGREAESRSPNPRARGCVVPGGTPVRQSPSSDRDRVVFHTRCRRSIA